MDTLVTLVTNILVDFDYIVSTSMVLAFALVVIENINRMWSTPFLDIGVSNTEYFFQFENIVSEIRASDQTKCLDL